MKLRNKIIAKGLFHSSLQFLLIMLFAWFNDCIFEMIVYYICFFYFRTKFEKQYHALTSWGCTFLTIIIYYIISNILPNKSITVLLIIILTYFVNLTSFYYRDYLDIKKPKKKKRNSNRQQIIKILGENNLDEESIERFCISKGIPKLSETIYLFLNNTLEETASILGVDNSTITRRIVHFIEENTKG